MNITIVGLGVIGGSIGLSLKGKIYGVNMQGIDLSEDTIKKALELEIIEDGAIDGQDKSFEIIKNSDMIILSIYPDAIKLFINKYKNYFKKDLIIVDTSGVKGNIIKDVKLPEDIDFILVHPMAGREKKGIEYASRKVFIGANFIITATKNNKPENIEEIKYLAKKMGFARIVETSVEKHDEIIAFTSQLPHVIAVALVNSDNLSVDTGGFVGDSYKEITRIANINEDLWSELFLRNKKNLISKINDFEVQIDKLKLAIESDNEDELKKMFISSAERRKKM